MNEHLKPYDLKSTCTRAALRHWVSVGLLPDEREIHGGQRYRIFPAAMRDRIERIAMLRQKGLSCTGVKHYFDELEKKTAKCTKESEKRPSESV